MAIDYQYSNKPDSLSSNELLFRIRKSLLDAFITTLLALAVFGPIVGLELDGYDFQLQLKSLVSILGVIFTGRLVASLFFQTSQGEKLLEKFSRKDTSIRVQPLNQKAANGYWIIALFMLAGLMVPFLASKYWITVIILGMIYVLLGLGLNIVVGLAGLLDLGFVAFYAIGAYGLALGHEYLGLGFWSMLPLAALLAALSGALLGFPVLRMHGDYLAIVTLGFGEIIRLVLNNWTQFTGGPNGVSAPAPTLFGLEFKRRVKEGTPFHEYFGLSYDSAYKFIFIYLILFALVWAVLYINHRLTKMPVGRAWEALREDEIACRSLGLNHVLVKLSAFMTGAAVGGIAGVFFATYQGFVNPTSFTFFESALILAIVVLGGLGSTKGVVIAAFVLTVMPEVLRDFSEYRILMFGLLMVLMMIWRPRGLVRMTRSSFQPPQTVRQAMEGVR
ncbi:high-affinity branched-chain amino acid ABC transporter permease LivM [Endozoicomonas arenosclerae]|uniref:high-affinity branched-chain amino acid ABC transporter permease LivM n=1 Tax=Endozoicomonas arenosclerae TaxID=1633495 RepID=UPI0009A21973|nr:high-affinity branched-chain amino acid ABC transporter permease LivM [Endozoicomonas arenosclerae]